MIFVVLALFLISMIGFALADNEEDKVCCESYGWGANMIKCCETYEWTTNEECARPEGFTGGGRTIVDNSYCIPNEIKCQDSEGTWKQFNNGCVDSCELARQDSDNPIICTQATTMGCDCGEDECWNGEECEKNQEAQTQNQKNNSGEDNQIQNQVKVLTQAQIKKIKQVKNRIRAFKGTGECPDNCTCAGSTTKCGLKGERTMTITAGKSGNTIIQVKGVNASTKVELYKSEEKLYGVFNGETKRILTPEQVQEKIRERKQKTWEEHNITLNEEGYYRVQSKKKARLFLLIPVREKVRTQIDAETGEIIKIRNSWWGFLANDIKEELLVGASCGTVNPNNANECCVNKGYDAWNSEAFECFFEAE